MTKSFDGGVPRWAGLALGTALTLGACGLMAGCESGAAAKPAAKAPPLPVDVVVARRATVPQVATPNGTTRALNEVSVRARVRGVLETMHFREGADVKAGDLLFEIEKAPFENALAVAKAKLAEAEAALKKAQDSQAVPIAEAQVKVNEAVLSLAKVEEARFRSLKDRNAASQNDVDQRVAAREKNAAELEAALASLAQAKVDFAINIRAAEAAVASAKADVAQAELDLSYCTITAPIDGRIGEARVKVGNLVGPMTSTATADYTELATIEQLDPMGVDIQASSRYLEKAARLMREGVGGIELTRTGADGEPAVHPEKGRATFIDNRIDPTTSTVLIRAEFANPDGTLLPGEYVKLAMTVGELEGVVVPQGAVVETQAGPVVYVAGEDGKVAMARVTGEALSGGMRVIESGLEPGARVIVSGLQMIRPGQEVVVREAAGDGSR
jgi:membrane fusion protein (multidrug efflux system)